MSFLHNATSKILGLPEPLVGVLHKHGLNTRKTLCRIVDALLFPRDFALAIALGKGSSRSIPHLLHPRDFNEATLKRMLFDREWKYAEWSDKFAVRDYVRKKVGPSILVPLLWSGTDLKEVEKMELPSRFVIKANHGSGTNLIVRDKTVFDWKEALKTTANWLREDYSARFGEWQYRWMSRKILVEQFLEQPDGLLLDFKIHVFHGKPLFVQVIDRVGTHCECGYDPQWNRLGWALTYPVLNDPIPKPKNLSEMLEIAHELSDDTPYVRVDLYNIEGKVFFGELTLHPGAAALHGGTVCDTEMFKTLQRKPEAKP